jgi:D-erythronate 2-dehydrogenase
VKILVTGAAGFLGRRLIASLLAPDAAQPVVSTIVAADLTECAIADDRIRNCVGSVADDAFARSIVETDVDVVYHLAAVLSGQAEAEFDAGIRVNVDGTRRLLDACRRLARPPRFVFSSTIAVLGGPLPETVPEDQVVRPQSSYGAEKSIGEVLVSEYSRRGFVDGIVCRVPTVAVRPGRPNSALSSFVSGIIREPLAGQECICPVPLDTRIWVSSPGAATWNLAHAGRLAASTLEAGRVVNLPGLSVTPGDILDCLERLGGTAARARVRIDVDPQIARIVGSWPGAFDIRRALALGFRGDRDIDAVVTQFMAEGRG